MTEEIFLSVIRWQRFTWEFSKDYQSSFSLAHLWRGWGGVLSFICVCRNIVPYALMLYTLFYKQRFFSTLPQCCLAFSWIELQMLLRYCLIHISCWLIHITIIILEHFLYLFYLNPCLDLCLFRPYLCYLFFIFIFIFIIINRIIWLKQTQLFFCLFFRIFSFIFGWYHGWRMWIISN